MGELIVSRMSSCSVDLLCCGLGSNSLDPNDVQPEVSIKYGSCSVFDTTGAVLTPRQLLFT